MRSGLNNSGLSSESIIRLAAVLLVAAFILSSLVMGTVFAGGQDRQRTTQSTTPPPSPQSANGVPQKVASPTPTPKPADTSGLGEAPPVPRLKPTPTPTPPEEIDPESILRINADLVQLHVRVIDRNNRPIDNVGLDQFHVYEDGVPQPIESFTREEVPISYGLAVDTSGSLRTQLQSVIDAGKTIINSNKKGDETFLIRFIGRDNTELIQDFTTKQDLLIDAIDNLYVEGGQTAVIDAVYLAAEHATEPSTNDREEKRRRALIVITDGEDRGSVYTQDQLFARLREEDVQIFVIGFINELDKEAGLIRKSPREKAVNLINKLASETGGRAFFPESLSDLPRIANEIVRDMRTQYVLAYNPTNKTPDGTFRAIRVAVDSSSSGEKRIPLTRNGRIARRENPNAPKAPSVRLPVTTTKKP